VLLPGVMLVVLAAEAGAVILARRQCADDRTQATDPDATQETQSGAAQGSQ
jgi:hypothetical protein